MYMNCLHKIGSCSLYCNALRIAVRLHRGIHTLVRLKSKRSTESYNEDNIKELYQNQSALPSLFLPTLVYTDQYVYTDMKLSQIYLCKITHNKDITRLTTVTFVCSLTDRDLRRRNEKFWSVNAI